MMKHRLLAGGLLGLLALTATQAAFAHNEGLPSAPASIKNVEHVANLPNASGNSIDFFERKLEDGTIKRYVVAATQGNGFDIVDITDPGHPKTVGRYVGPGLNYHAWVSVNPKRKIVALTIEEPAGRAVRHGGASGIQFVDISDVTNPVPLGKLDGLGGPHTVRMIGDNHAYTTLPTYVVDYSDPMNPKAERRGQIEGHEFWQDQNHPTRGYVGMATSSPQWGVMDLADPAKPTTTKQVPDLDVVAAHEVYPAPDSSFVGVADFQAGNFTLSCPGGGVHFWDISGKYVPGASLTNPKKMGAWFAPFTGLALDPSSTAPNYASCTMHSWNIHPERMLAIAGVYAGGTWVFDPSKATASTGEYVEFSGGSRGRTTWGNTVGNVRDAADYVNAAQFMPFDLEDPSHERLIVTNGWARGLDIYRYTGPLPKKMSRLQVDPSAAGGTIGGKLDRYAVLTYAGWKNLPLADRTVEVSDGTRTVTAVTAADGTFSAPLDLPAGNHTITVTWDGDDRFGSTTVTAVVTA